MSSKYQVKPFKIDISAADLDDLMLRLKRTRFSHDFGNDDWRYGYNTAYHRELIEFLINKYDWRDVERRMNDLPQFKIDLMGVPLTGLSTHFPAQTSHYLPTHPDQPQGIANDPALGLPVASEYSEEEAGWFESGKLFVERESGYGKIQLTKPQTLAALVTDSPAGQLAWVTEKRYFWGLAERGVGAAAFERVWPKEDLISTAAVYFLPERAVRRLAITGNAGATRGRPTMPAFWWWACPPPCRSIKARFTSRRLPGPRSTSTCASIAFTPMAATSRRWKSPKSMSMM